MGPVGWQCLATSAIAYTLNGEFGYNELGDYSFDADVNIIVVPGFVVTPGVGYMHTTTIDGADDDRRAVGRLPPHPVHLLIGCLA